MPRKRIEHKWIDGVKCKRCGHCKEWKPLDCFHKDKYGWDSLYSICKKCKKQYCVNSVEKIKQYRSDNAEKTKQRSNQLSLYVIYADKLMWCEEIRKNKKFLEVKCAYCGKWFSPTNQQVRNRIAAINTVKKD